MVETVADSMNYSNIKKQDFVEKCFASRLIAVTGKRRPLLDARRCLFS